MKQQKNDAYSPNSILGALLISGFCLIIVCGQSLWIPASRVSNLYVRSVVLSLSDAAAAFASSTGLDVYLPKWRLSFLTITGLAGHTSWDTRYYNKRSTDEILPTALPPSPVAEKIENDIIIASEIVSELSPLPEVPVFTPSMNKIHSTENPLKIFMFGDSQVFSLGSGLSRLAGKGSPLDVEFLAIHSSGFIRGDYYNWPAKLSDTFREQPYEAAVMMLGMNDYQSFWNNKGEIMKKCTPEWESAYKDKCRNIIDIALSSVPRLYWIGMPAVKNSMYDSNLTYIDSVQESLAQEYSPDVLIRISLRDTIPGKDKVYTDTVALDAEKTLKVMSPDGTHYTVEGGQFVMNPLFNRLSSDYLFAEVPVANLSY